MLRNLIGIITFIAGSVLLYLGFGASPINFLQITGGAISLAIGTVCLLPVILKDFDPLDF